MTGTLSPVAIPFEIAPIVKIPVNAGANVTLATCVKLLFGVGEANRLAVTVILVPTKERAAVVLK